MAGRSCLNCAYAICDPEEWLRSIWKGESLVPRCANHPWWPGQLHDVPGVPCRKYQPRPPLPAGENVRLIPLNHGFYAYVDAADYEWARQWRWHVCPGGYAVRYEKGKTIFMHREIMKPPKGKVVDHISGYRLDNTRANMRNVTRRQNSCNRAKHFGTTSIYKGVSYRKHMSKWHAQVRCGDVIAKAGPFQDEAAAGRAYDRMAVELFGEHARLNFPREWPPEQRAQVYAAARAKRKALRAKAARAKRRKGRSGTKKGPRNR